MDKQVIWMCPDPDFSLRLNWETYYFNNGGLAINFYRGLTNSNRSLLIIPLHDLIGSANFVADTKELTSAIPAREPGPKIYLGVPHHPMNMCNSTSWFLTCEYQPTALPTPTGSPEIVKFKLTDLMGIECSHNRKRRFRKEFRCSYFL